VRNRGALGSLAGTSVLLGCSDRDPHIPARRVAETAEVLRDMEAEVTEIIYRASDTRSMRTSSTGSGPCWTSCFGAGPELTEGVEAESGSIPAVLLDLKPSASQEAIEDLGDLRRPRKVDRVSTGNLDRLLANSRATVLRAATNALQRSSSASINVRAVEGQA